QAALNPKKCGASLALADIDRDGDLDVYIANYRVVTMRDEPNAPFRVNNDAGRMMILEYKGRRVTEPDLAGRFSVGERGRIVENGEADVLYRNDGQGRFTALSVTDGMFLDEDDQPLRSPPYDWGLSVMMRDIDGEGTPDIYVCNDFASPDRIWLNTGQGKFRAMPRTALRHTSMFSMGVDFADIDRDGEVDFFVVDMLGRQHLGRHLQIGGVPPCESTIGGLEDRPQFAHNTVFKNRGDGTFAEIAWFAALHASEWSWTPIFLDVDLDGYEDLLITTGHERDAMNADIMDRAEAMKAQKQLSEWQLLSLNNLFGRLATPNFVFRNGGDLGFEEVGGKWGFNTPGVSHGMCLADLDNDGDLDVVMNNLNEEAGVYRNEAGQARVAVRLKGKAPNTAGIGAKITVRGGPVPQQSQEMICGGRYLSGDDALRVFAAGSATNRLSIEVSWRGGGRTVVSNAQPNRLYEILEEGAAAVTPPAARNTHSPSAALFQDVSGLLGHIHHEEPFDDFARQPLLPWRLSQLGPGVAWEDLDGDQREDLIIGSGKGGALAIYHNDGRGGFTRLTNGPLSKAVSRDQTSVVGMGSLVLVGSANYEDGLTNGGCVRVYDVGRGVSGESVLGPVASTGPLALGDIDGDGDLDLFVGGRAVAGRYPEPALSQWLRDEGGRFVPAQKWEQMGLVSGAVLSDLDGDGKPELVAACEWGPVRVFGFKDGLFEEQTQALGLNQYQGWWHGVSTGDLDGDGRLDIVASNWGRNSKYAGSPERPWKLYYGDLNGAGQVDLIEARWEPSLQKEVPERGWRMVRAAVPFLQEKLSSYEAYGKASLPQIYGERLESMRVVEVNTVGSMLFLNRGKRFEAVELPVQAQWAPAFGICVADADGDGAEDLFLSQNFFALNPETGRQDAGRGLWLKGDGHGRLRPMAGQESGIKIYGEQRGCAVSDYDGDGRVDLAVSQNGAQTRLYRNVSACPGLRVRLKGPPGNPTGVGAALRLEYAEGKGPIREVHAGSGYGSQDGAVQVLGMSQVPTGLWVRWPGGK
ncbi:MAG TPA: FG-GAP-like repeat-containing protein, partial [Terriglobales bacterium]|nr:FG-GAP-like repeat-containing protein [Terriglobales bacterium]